MTDQEINQRLIDAIFGKGYSAGLPDEPEGYYWDRIDSPSSAQQTAIDEQGNVWTLVPRYDD